MTDAVSVVWRIPLTAHLASTLPLSSDEELRAARFHSPHHAHRYRVAHWALRDILARATGIPPAELRFRADATGKPHLDHPGAPAFNLSHAHEQALVAVGDDATPLGVDIEYHAPVPEMRGVAASHFAPEERDALAADDWSPDTFYRIWTRKEAFVKATGSGVGPALSRFAVSAARDDVRILRADDHPNAPATWALRDLGIEAPYSGALVVCGQLDRLELHDWIPQPGAAID